jgi:hypothetical protein
MVRARPDHKLGAEHLRLVPSTCLASITLCHPRKMFPGYPGESVVETEVVGEKGYTPNT